MNSAIAKLDAWMARHFPEGRDEADTRRQRFMVLLAFGVLPLATIGAIHEGYVGNPVGVVINLATLLVNVGAVWMIRVGQGRWAPWPAVFITLVLSNIATLYVGGAGQSGFAGNFVILVLAAIMLPRWAVAVVVLLQTAIAALMFRFPADEIVEFSNDMHVWTWFVCLALTGFMVAALVSVTESLLDRANQKSLALEGTLRELRETSVSRDFVQGVLSSVPDYLLVTNADGRIVMVNGAFDTTAWARDDLIGRPLSDVVHGATPSLTASEGQLDLGDGTLIPVALNRGEVRAETGSGDLAVWSATDIRLQHATADALRQAHERAHSASQAKSNFLANMSHELRTPLNAIIGYGELLGDEIDDAEQRADLGRIGAAARTLLELINGVLDLSRVESGKIELTFAHTPLAAITDPVVSMIEPLATARGLELIVEVEREGPPVYTDASKLRQVLTNLLTNATKFTDRGTITLRGARWKRSGLDWLRFEVLDTGIGMASEHLEVVFEPFAQIDDDDRTRAAGTGLGLSISRAFIEMMGGQVYVESEVGRGTRFVVEVPAGKMEALHATPTPSRPLPHAADTGQTILVIDDDPRFLELIHRVLGTESRQLVCTSSPQQALQWARVNRADLVLLDIAMPGVDGWSVLVRLQDTPCAGAPVLVISGEGDADVARALGAAGYLPKPVPNEVLRANVSAVLDAAAADGRPAPAS